MMSYHGVHGTSYITKICQSPRPDVAVLRIKSTMLCRGCRKPSRARGFAMRLAPVMVAASYFVGIDAGDGGQVNDAPKPVPFQRRRADRP